MQCMNLLTGSVKHFFVAATMLPFGFQTDEDKKDVTFEHSLSSLRKLKHRPRRS